MFFFHSFGHWSLRFWFSTLPSLHSFQPYVLFRDPPPPSPSRSRNRNINSKQIIYFSFCFVFSLLSGKMMMILTSSNSNWCFARVQRQQRKFPLEWVRLRRGCTKSLAESSEASGDLKRLCNICKLLVANKFFMLQILVNDTFAAFTTNCTSLMTWPCPN